MGALIPAGGALVLLIIFGGWKHPPILKANKHVIYVILFGLAVYVLYPQLEGIEDDTVDTVDTGDTGDTVDTGDTGGKDDKAGKAGKAGTGGKGGKADTVDKVDKEPVFSVDALPSCQAQDYEGIIGAVYYKDGGNQAFGQVKCTKEAMKACGFIPGHGSAPKMCREDVNEEFYGYTWPPTQDYFTAQGTWEDLGDIDKENMTVLGYTSESWPQNSRPNMESKGWGGLSGEEQTAAISVGLYGPTCSCPAIPESYKKTSEKYLNSDELLQISSCPDVVNYTEPYVKNSYLDVVSWAHLFMDTEVECTLEEKKKCGTISGKDSTKQWPAMCKISPTSPNSYTSCHCQEGIGEEYIPQIKEICTKPYPSVEEAQINCDIMDHYGVFGSRARGDRSGMVKKYPE